MGHLFLSFSYFWQKCPVNGNNLTFLFKFEVGIACFADFLLQYILLNALIGKQFHCKIKHVVMIIKSINEKDSVQCKAIPDSKLCARACVERPSNAERIFVHFLL